MLRARHSLPNQFVQAIGFKVFLPLGIVGQTVGWGARALGGEFFYGLP
jgi:hypothetical protein